MFERNELVSVNTQWGYSEMAIIRDVLGRYSYEVLYDDGDYEIAHVSDLSPMVYGPNKHPNDLGPIMKYDPKAEDS